MHTIEQDSNDCSNDRKDYGHADDGDNDQVGSLGAMEEEERRVQRHEIIDAKNSSRNNKYSSTRQHPMDETMQQNGT